MFRSIPRADATLNVQPPAGTNINSGCSGAGCFTFAPPQFGVEDTDPYTPMLRAYEGDKVQIRTLVGAHMSPHTFTVHGVNWLFEPTQFDASDNTSGYRSTQPMGISEHYEFLFTLPRTDSKNGVADYLYSSSSDTPGLSSGNWGIMRGYRTQQPTPGLVPLPNNVPPADLAAAPPAPPTCPAAAPQKRFEVVAARARDVLGGPVVYNARGRAGQGGSQQLVNWNALAYFLKQDLGSEDRDDPAGHAGRAADSARQRGRLHHARAREPHPRRPAEHRQQLARDRHRHVARGRHPSATRGVRRDQQQWRERGEEPSPDDPAQEERRSDAWYAGRIEVDGGGKPQYIPVEFGSIPLTPSDPLMQHPFGLLGALIVEPESTSWRTDDNSRASATVCKGTTPCKDGDVLFREFVVIVQDDVSSMRQTRPTVDPSQPINIVGTVLNGSVTWAMGGQPLPAGGIPLAAGQTVNFDIQTGTHGLLFDDEASAKAVFDIDGSPDKAKFQTFPTKCTLTNSYGTVPQASGHIATLKAKTAFTLSLLPYVCSQHCQNMKGSFTLGTTPAPGIPPTDPAPFNYTRAINYRMEPLDYRFPDPDWLDNFDILAPIGISRALSNAIVLADPQTPVFAARAGTPIRFRMVHPAGINEQVFTLHGHVWQEEPYINGSKADRQEPAVAVAGIA